MSTIISIIGIIAIAYTAITKGSPLVVPSQDLISFPPYEEKSWMGRVTVLYIYGDSRTYDDNIMQEDISVNWIKCIYASAKRTNSQLSSSYIACIAFMMDSQPASCP